LSATPDSDHRRQLTDAHVSWCSNGRPMFTLSETKESNTSHEPLFKHLKAQIRPALSVIIKGKLHYHMTHRALYVQFRGERCQPELSLRLEVKFN